MGIRTDALRVPAVALAALLLAACASPGASVPAAESSAPEESTAVSAAPAESEAASGTKEFTIASTSFSLSSVPLLAALDALREEGYTIEYPALTGPDLVAEGLVRNDFNFAIVGFNAITVAIEAGAPAKNVMSQFANPWFMYAATDIEECADLQGRRLAIHSEQSTSAAFGFDWIERECPGTEPEVLIISGSENRYAAMIAGEVDASAVEIADAVALQEEAGDRFHELVSFAETLPDILTNTIAVNTDFAAENPDTVVALLTALLEQHRMIADDPEYFPSLVEEYRPYIGGVVTDRAIELQAELFQTDGGFTEEYVEATLQFMRDIGALESELGVEDVADFSYLEQALENVGD
jgi:NitT/TauT family transport system substrate-binding protein